MRTIWTCLVRIKSKEGLRSHVIEKPSFTLGRTQEADFPILDPSVSRVHLSVEIRGELIWLTDRNSANGSVVNGSPMEPGQVVAVSPDDVIRMGNCELEFQFMCIPKPFEMLSEEDRKELLIDSTMQKVLQDAEGRTREQIEKEHLRARIEVEQLLSQARKDAEILRTQAMVDLQSRKSSVEAECVKLRQDAQAAASQDRLQGRREADLLVTEAQKRIQKDYEDANRQMESKLKDTQAKCLKTLQDAEEKAQSLLTEAQHEASQVRLDAVEDARKVQQEALRKSTDSFTEMQDRFQSEVEAKREEIISQAKAEAERDRDRIMKESAMKIESLKRDCGKREAELAILREEAGKFEAAKNAYAAEGNKLKEDLEKARALLAQVEDLEARRAVAERELAKYIKTREEGVASLDREFRDLRDKHTVEFESRKNEQQSELAKQKLKALEDLRKHIEGEEKKYEERKTLRAIELSQRLSERLVPKLSDWARDPSTAGGQAKDAIEAAVRDSLLNEKSPIRVDFVAESSQKSADPERRAKRFVQGAAAALVMSLVAIGLFREDIVVFVRESGVETYASKVMEARKAAAVYSPEQTDEFRDNYTDNVLHMKDYFQAKTESEYIEKWTLKLNKLDFVRSMGLSEEDVVSFIAKETNLIQRLGVFRDSIDAVYLQEGLNRMREAEGEAMGEFKATLKSEANIQKIRELEKEFLAEYLRERAAKAAKH